MLDSYHSQNKLGGIARTRGEMLKSIRRCAFLFMLLTSVVYAQQRKPAPAQRTSRYLDTVRNQPLLLAVFLKEMPKGGDLHNHLSGAAYAETFLQLAARDGFCIDQKTFTLLASANAPPANDPNAPTPTICKDATSQLPAANALTDPILFRHAIDAMSMRHFVPGAESGHDHFFDTFGKFGAVSGTHTGEMIAEVASRAAEQREQYLELMFGLVPRIAFQQGSGPISPSEDDFESERTRLLAQIRESLSEPRLKIDRAETRWREILGCGTAQAQPGCKVKVRYLYEAYRGFPPAQVFAMMLAGFELTTIDPRVVGVNFVMPEDGYISMRDYALHMKIISFMHKHYPQVHISLHAGELAPGLVPTEGLKSHIQQAVEVGHAERIGHGVDVLWEEKPLALLKDLAARHILVEICLTSNDGILGVSGKEHPLPLYMKYGVPVAIATDDEGVSRSDMTHELRRAVEDFGLSYDDLKQMERQSLEHAFLPGESLWTDLKKAAKNKACAALSSQTCSDFLNHSEKAMLQEQLERAFQEFEAKY